jgi:hypothetical protein
VVGGERLERHRHFRLDTRAVFMMVAFPPEGEDEDIRRVDLDVAAADIERKNGFT